MIEDHRPVLRPNIIALPVQCRRIVDGEEDFENVAIRNYIRMEGKLNHFHVPRTSGAHILVGRIGRASSHVARYNHLHALSLAVNRLETPETTATERCDLVHNFCPDS